MLERQACPVLWGRGKGLNPEAEHVSVSVTSESVYQAGISSEWRS